LLKSLFLYLLNLTLACLLLGYSLFLSLSLFSIASLLFSGTFLLLKPSFLTCLYLQLFLKPLLSLEPSLSFSLRLSLLSLNHNRLLLSAALLGLLFFKLLQATLLFVLSLSLPIELFLLKSVAFGLLTTLSFKPIFLILSLSFKSLGFLTGSPLSSLSLNVRH